MAYIPGCSADVFISYAHRDNRDGWVTRLKDKLIEKLTPFLAGHTAEVWFDDRLRPGVYFKEEIQQKLKDTPIFVAVVSPAYLDSEFSIVNELDWFQNQPGSSEIIQLLKVPLEKGQEVPLPASGYEVLHDPKDGHLLDSEALDKILDKVVAAITGKLRDFWELRPKIYVAQIRNEQWKPRWDELKDLLHAEGYAILPKGILPLRVPDGRIREWLESARLSVHLEGVADDPLAQRQLEIARQTGRPAIVLSAPPAEDQLPAIVAEVQDRIQSDRKPAVYLIYDYYSDRSRVAAFPELIRLKTGCDVFEPVAGETYHKFRLQVSDGVLLFRSEAPEEWLKSQEQSLLQAAARRQTAEAKYFTRSPNGHPAGVRVTQGSRQEWIIERTGEPDVSDLQPFFDALRSRVQAVGGTAP
ncbi:MAG TPA: toll/interleukin-1 receptor domain-containing protein [Bryobacteraceae bacterium]